SAAAAAVVAIAVLGLVWLVMRPSAAADSQGSGDAEPSVSVSAQASDPARPSGPPSELDAVEVLSVTGDVTFWVGPSEAEQTFVVLDESIQGETAVTVRAGQRLRIIGTMMETPVEGVQLSASDEKALEKETSYLRARYVEILDG
ncbi:MAG: hypothetical protein H0X16_07180, partial [Chloroflexi bacterium]|nr:hypothetical protein [Chloroflexota bacterium]